MTRQKKKNQKINIYQLEGIKDTNKTKIKIVGYINGDAHYEDEEIIIDETNKSIIKEIMESVYVKMYKCRMTDDYVAKYKKLPLMYASLFYEKKFVTGYLFSIYIYFEIKTDTNKFKSLEALLNSVLEGKYSIEIVMDEKSEIIEIDSFGGYNETVNNLMEIIKTEEIGNIIKSELKKRDDERRERMGNIVENKPKEPKYNFTELLNKYQNEEDLNKIIHDII